jgi:hypothetical protein
MTAFEPPIAADNRQCTAAVMSLCFRSASEVHTVILTPQATV